MSSDTKVPDRWTDNAKTISLRLWRGIIRQRTLLHVFQPTKTIFKLVQNAPPPSGCHVFQAKGTIFKLVQDIIGTNFLTKFHDDQTINVSSRTLRQPYKRTSYIKLQGIRYLRGLIEDIKYERTSDIKYERGQRTICKVLDTKRTILKYARYQTLNMTIEDITYKSMKGFRHYTGPYERTSHKIEDNIYQLRTSFIKYERHHISRKKNGKKTLKRTNSRGPYERYQTPRGPYERYQTPRGPYERTSHIMSERYQTLQRTRRRHHITSIKVEDITYQVSDIWASHRTSHINYERLQTLKRTREPVKDIPYQRTSHIKYERGHHISSMKVEDITYQRTKDITYQTLRGTYERTSHIKYERLQTIRGLTLREPYERYQTLRGPYERFQFFRGPMTSHIKYERGQYEKDITYQRTI
ncbi:hypothetical protein DPMN_118009 [Dreissena polymorpha]|uniref:Uncharacterized protein n=1 Tax=Dreissena polymorpha TaxID=45954 RepID=A0A9D4GJE1_DREPO|nr:hypothetical protein DPMN_118009 [Dreissena polymorpha]